MPTSFEIALSILLNSALIGILTPPHPQSLWSLFKRLCVYFLFSLQGGLVALLLLQ